MKTHLYLFALAICPLVSAPAAEPPPIVMKPDHGELLETSAREIRVSFATPMVDVSKLRREGQPSPILFEPIADIRWVWLTQSEGKLYRPEGFLELESFGHMFRVRHRAKLRPNLRDLAGQPVEAKGWGVEFADDRFALRGLEFLNTHDPEDEMEEPDLPERDLKPVTANRAALDRAAAEEEEKRTIQSRKPEAPLPARPRVRLEFSRDVPPAEAIKSIHYEDRDTGEKFPVEVNLEERQQLAPQGWLLIEPAAPLPPGRRFYLVIDRLREPGRGETLPVMRSVSAGTTYPPEIKDVRGYHQPTVGAFIRAAGNQAIDSSAENLKLIQIAPPVADFRVTPTGNGFEGTGRFDPKSRYQVTLKAGLLTADGFKTARDSVWPIAFGAKRPSVILPERTIYQRASAPAVRCEFVQVNTGPLEWKLARIPRPHLTEVLTRVREFGYYQRDKDEAEYLVHPDTGEHLYKPTDLLIAKLKLPVVASARIAESGGDAETKRQIEWKPGDHGPGLYLLEISGTDARGRTVGNRSIISRTDWMLTEVRTPERALLRASDLGTGRVVPGLSLTPLDYEHKPTAPIVTDARGEAAVKKGGSERMLASIGGAECLVAAKLADFRAGSTYAGSREDTVTFGMIVTDRNVYRPGETVKWKGYVRTRTKDQLSIPAATKIAGSIISESEVTVENFAAVVSPTGSYEMEWKTPPNAYGEYTIYDGISSTRVTLSEFRPPPFTVTVEPGPEHGETVTATVSSRLFHGAPNAGAKLRWKAEWIADTWRGGEDEDAPRNADEPYGLRLDDQHSPDSPSRGFSGEVLAELKKAGWSTAREDREVQVSGLVSGEATLDAQGRAVLRSKSPFATGTHGRARIHWIAELTSAETAQTVRGGAVFRNQLVPKILGVALSWSGAELEVVSLNAQDQLEAGLAVKAEVFSMEIKTAKERLAPGINRYRNTPTFQKVWEATLVTPAVRKVDLPSTGHRVVRVTATNQPGTPAVSAASLAYDLDEDEGLVSVSVPVAHETSLQVRSDRARYRVGEEIVLSVESPITGVATVSVQADDILHSETIELKSNAQQIRLKVLPGFAPNAWVCVHVLKPGPGDALAAERFGACAIAVEQPGKRLDVTPTLAAETVEPGARVSGAVKVQVGGAPVVGAEVLLFAVNEAILALGQWELPNFFSAFFPPRPWQVEMSAGLGSNWTPDRWLKFSHTEKGFILGDVGLLRTDFAFRNDFKPLAFWKGDLRTDARGEAAFEFTAPDSLTSYRVVAVVQNGADQIGHGHRLLRVNKQLQVEPVLPTFLRNDDDIILRTAVRQDYAASDEFDVGVKVEGVTLNGPAVQRVTVKRGAPVIVDFPARATATAARAKIGFAAKSVSRPGIQDGEENSFVVHPPTIERTEVVAGTFTAAKPLDVSTTAAPWLQAQGSCDVLVSGSPFLAKLAGLPKTLDAQGSTEKLATRILAAAMLTRTFDYLPGADSETQRRTRVQDAVKKLAQSIAPDGGLPRWPGAAKDGARRDDLATIEGAWAIRSAAQHGFAVDPALLAEAGKWLRQIAAQELGADGVTPSLRCLAFMAYGQSLAKEEQEEAKELEPNADELFAAREELKLTLEDRAWLALALHYLGQLPEARRQLLREISRPVPEQAFDPENLSSRTRAEAVCLLARSEIESATWSKPVRERMHQAFEKITTSSFDLSTHENLWLLLVFNSLTRGENPPAMDKLTPKPALLSKNKISAGWLGVPLERIPATFATPIRSKVSGSYLLRTRYRPTEGAKPASPGAFQIQREVRNLTAVARTGSLQAPWQAGDHVLVTYRLESSQPQSHVELEDPLPACLETVNPMLPAIRENFPLPVDASVNTLKLSQVELRFARNLLYFEKVQPGRNTYSVLARVVVPGAFAWPAAQVRAMYDSRFTGESEPTLISVR